MKNITQLRAELSRVFSELRAGTLEAKDAAEMNNTAGKIINSIKVEIEYYAIRKEKPEIAFLDDAQPADSPQPHKSE